MGREEAWPKYLEGTPVKATYLEAERKARDAKLGLWAEQAPHGECARFASGRVIVQPQSFRCSDYPEMPCIPKTHPAANNNTMAPKITVQHSDPEPAGFGASILFSRNPPVNRPLRLNATTWRA